MYFLLKLISFPDNSRPDVGVQERQESPIIGLKNFNNWIKSVLIAKFGKRAFDGAPPPPPGDLKCRGKVLDMGCGKGGDLQKWQKARVREYVGLGTSALLLVLFSVLTLCCRYRGCIS